MEKKTYRKIEKEFKVGEIIFSENDTCDGLYIINSGRVRIYRKIKGGEIELSQIGEKEIFGEMALIDEQKRSASAIALQHTKVTLITKEMFDDQIKRLPAWVFTLIKLFVTRIRITNEKFRAMVLESEGTSPAPETLPHGENQDTEATKENGKMDSEVEESVKADEKENAAPITTESGSPKNSPIDASHNEKKANVETDKLLKQLDF